ncbi:MAG TPA: hypothetical protein VK202_04055, partial [Bacteroidia bacterium]|nr:hypothetical protein [Bacteroidia bacterium]
SSVKFKYDFPQKIQKQAQEIFVANFCTFCGLFTCSYPQLQLLQVQVEPSLHLHSQVQSVHWQLSPQVQVFFTSLLMVLIF